ncbi:MAG: radical SAM protein, partial [Candidatus Omnitrophota bacterium]
MKVLFILSPSWGIETPHLGIALLAAGLRKHGFEVEVCDCNIQVHNKYKEKGLWKSEEDVHWEDDKSILEFIKENDKLLDLFVEEVLSKDALVIGFSVYNTTKRLSLELAKRIKVRSPDKFIILGGQQCFTKESVEGLIKDKAVDAIVMGEGDEIFPELVGKIDKLKKIDFCPGLIYKENGKIIDCGMRPPVSSLDRLPFPDFSDFSLQSYGNPHQLPILSSRGCPYPCVFCSTKLFWIKYRSMSGERIFQEIEYQLKRYEGVHFFTFNDHVINADMESLSNFCGLVLEKKSKKGQDSFIWDKLIWRGAVVIRPEMDKEFLKKMKESGCIELEYGIESGSSRIRERMKKHPISIEVVERVIRDTHEAGISVRANFMFGFPGETEEEFQETLRFLKKNKDVFTQVHPSETFCHVDPHTYLFDHYEEFGITNCDHSLFWESSDGGNNYLERFKRHQVFCQLANSLNIPLSPGGHKIMLHKEHFLEEYNKYIN